MLAAAFLKQDKLNPRFSGAKTHATLYCLIEGKLATSNPLCLNVMTRFLQSCLAEADAAKLVTALQDRTHRQTRQSKQILNPNILTLGRNRHVLRAETMNFKVKSGL